MVDLEVTMVARNIVDTAKENCPVGTPQSTGIPGYIGGTLKKTIRIIRRAARGATRLISIAVGGRYKNPNTGRIVDYAKHVHDGTSRMPSRPFLKDAYDQHKQSFVQALINAVKRTR